MSSFRGSYIKAVLDIAKTDPHCALSFVPNDLEMADKELTDLRINLFNEQSASDDYKAKLSDALDENAKLREVNSQTFCAYCEEKFSREDSDFEQLQNHIAVCKKHPLRVVEAALSQALAKNEQLLTLLTRCLSFLRDDVINEETGNCYYCGWTQDDGDMHKPDCRQVAVYIAVRNYLNGGEQ